MKQASLWKGLGPMSGLEQHLTQLAIIITITINIVLLYSIAIRKVPDAGKD